MIWTFITTELIIIGIFIFCIMVAKKIEDTTGAKTLIIGTVIAAIAISFAFFLLLVKNIINANENDFLAFEGAIIASMTAILGVAFTLKKTHEENEKRNALEKERYEERMIAEVQPMLVYRFERIYETSLFYREYNAVDFSFNDMPTSNHLVHFTVECVGDKPAKKLRLQSVKIEPKKETTYSKKWKQFLLPKDSEELYVELYKLPVLNIVDDCSKVEPIKIRFKVIYTDIYDNEYSQLVSIIIYPMAKNINDQVELEYVYEMENLPKPEIKKQKE